MSSTAVSLHVPKKTKPLLFLSPSPDVYVAATATALIANIISALFHAKPKMLKWRNHQYLGLQGAIKQRLKIGLGSPNPNLNFLVLDPFARLGIEGVQKQNKGACLQQEKSHLKHLRGFIPLWCHKFKQTMLLQIHALNQLSNWRPIHLLSPVESHRQFIVARGTLPRNTITY